MWLSAWLLPRNTQIFPLDSGCLLRALGPPKRLGIFISEIIYVWLAFISLGCGEGKEDSWKEMGKPQFAQRDVYFLREMKNLGVRQTWVLILTAPGPLCGLRKWLALSKTRFLVSEIKTATLSNSPVCSEDEVRKCTTTLDAALGPQQMLRGHEPIQRSAKMLRPQTCAARAEPIPDFSFFLSWSRMYINSHLPQMFPTPRFDAWFYFTSFPFKSVLKGVFSYRGWVGMCREHDKSSFAARKGGLGKEWRRVLGLFSFHL